MSLGGAAPPDGISGCIGAPLSPAARGSSLDASGAAPPAAPSASYDGSLVPGAPGSAPAPGSDS